jgi:Na+/phosphate symporter
LLKGSEIPPDIAIADSPMLEAKKTPDNVLQEELLKERAEVLSRAGERLAAALEKVHAVGGRIENMLADLNQTGKERGPRLNREAIDAVNREIKTYNTARDHAKLRYYYMIVTREAMGMRRHHWVDKFYQIPPKKKYLREER